jgi:hypothetical protein
MSKRSPDLTIARWRKFGQDRLYVALADGTKVGYWDLVTDEPHPEKPELIGVLQSAVAQMYGASRSSSNRTA